MSAIARSSGSDADGGARRGSASISTRHEASLELAKAAAQAVASRREPEAPPPLPVISDTLYDRRVGNGRDGLTIDLVYRDTGLRAVRLFGRSDTAPAEAASDGEAAVAAGTAARAYQAASAAAGAATTELTG